MTSEEGAESILARREGSNKNLCSSTGEAFLVVTEAYLRLPRINTTRWSSHHSGTINVVLTG